MAGHTVPLPLEFIDVQLLNDSVAIGDTDSPFQNSARMENVVVANHRRDLQLSHRLIDDIHGSTTANKNWFCMRLRLENFHVQ
eukprot:symbB.v1.2.018516.t1/scaffold1480.1/size116223/4